MRLEMAQQLHAQGEEVGLLVVFDSYAPGVSYTLPHTRTVWCRAGRFGQILYRHMKNLALLGAAERRHYMQQRLQHYKGRFQTDVLRRGLTLSHTASHTSPAVRGQQLMLRPYVPDVYPGQLTLFQSSVRLIGYNHLPQLGWGPFAADGVDTYEVPGHEGAMFYPPRVWNLAYQLRACLARAQAKVHI